jgi:hypothetical protein
LKRRRVRRLLRRRPAVKTPRASPTSSEGGQKIMRHSGSVLEAVVLAHCRIRVSL